MVEISAPLKPTGCKYDPERQWRVKNTPVGGAASYALIFPLCMEEVV